LDRAVGRLTRAAYLQNPETVRAAGQDPSEAYS
jgi:hypothetical protein